jgi:hypothetical protein
MQKIFENILKLDEFLLLSGLSERLGLQLLLRPNFAILRKTNGSS